MRVYIIEAGVYSDRHIIAVTLNREDAYKLCEAAVEDDYHGVASIREFDTDEYNVIDDGKKVFSVYIQNEGELLDACELHGKMDNLTIKDSGSFEGYENVLFKVRAKDEKEAMKIALDRFAEWRKKDEKLD